MNEGQFESILNDRLGKKLDELIQAGIERSWQNNGIKKDLANGKDKIGWKSIVQVVTIVGVLLGVIYYSAQSNIASNRTEQNLVSYKQINDERYTVINKNLDEIKQELRDLRKDVGAK